MTRIANVALDSFRNDAARVFDWLQATPPEERPHIVTIQKSGPERYFPKRDLRRIEYKTCCVDGRLRYLGVAVLSHRDLPEAQVVDSGLPDAAEGDSRFLTVSVGGLWVSSVYVPFTPKGAKGERDVIRRRVAWLNRLREHIREKGYHRHDTLLCGDFNVKFGCEVDGERGRGYDQDDEDALHKILDLGFVDLYRDTYRDVTEKPGHTRGYGKNGMSSRLHLMLASDSLARRRREIRLDLDSSPRPRDDAPPLVLELEGLEL